MREGLRDKLSVCRVAHAVFILDEASGRISEKARLGRRPDCLKTSSRQVSHAAWNIVFFSSTRNARFFSPASVHIRPFLDFLGLSEPSFDLSTILN